MSIWATCVPASTIVLGYVSCTIPPTYNENSSHRVMSVAVCRLAYDKTLGKRLRWLVIGEERGTEERKIEDEDNVDALEGRRRRVVGSSSGILQDRKKLRLPNCKRSPTGGCCLVKTSWPGGKGLCLYSLADVVDGT